MLISSNKRGLGGPYSGNINIGCCNGSNLPSFYIPLCFPDDCLDSLPLPLFLCRIMRDERITVYIIYNRLCIGTYLNLWKGCLHLPHCLTCAKAKHCR